jgi:hypothetical protein
MKYDIDVKSSNHWDFGTIKSLEDSFKKSYYRKYKGNKYQTLKNFKIDNIIYFDKRGF